MTAKTKVVSIEEKIPGLKEYKDQVRRRKLFGLLAVFGLLIVIVIFLISPLSRVQSIEVVNNNRLTTAQVLALTEIEKDVSIFGIHSTIIEKKLIKSRLIEQAELKRSGINTYRLTIKEMQPVAYMPKDKGYIPLLSSGLLDENNLSNYPIGNEPLIIGFDNNKQVLDELAEQLTKTPAELRNTMSEIIYKPTKINKNRLNINMNDGFQVVIGLADFSTSIKTYPSIVGQVTDGSTGIIDLEVGAFYQSYYNQDKTNKSK